MTQEEKNKLNVIDEKILDAYISARREHPNAVITLKRETKHVWDGDTTFLAKTRFFVQVDGAEYKEQNT